ncbi:uncharacterized protein LOC131437901 isoform X2 [Malaya genurostris]|uniref:uncharacterized protein LOC131437901 isoform X2 n=1 Tax=Malaya genurostris TaxID=325434 RepID=UPI0026F3EE4E|nr:uncharacterized protein LOC131437901 isoform X2 [Malaya genurostris]
MPPVSSDRQAAKSTKNAVAFYEHEETEARISPERTSSTNPESTMRCTLCLRVALENDFLSISKDLQQTSDSDIQNKLDRLTNFLSFLSESVRIYNICRTCLMLIEMINDFKQCCCWAESWAKQHSEEHSFQKDTDDWWSSSTTDKIKHIHSAIQERAEFIEMEEKNRNSQITDETPASYASLIKLEIDFDVERMDHDGTDNKKLDKCEGESDTENESFSLTRMK